MTRTDILNILIAKFNYRSYLEIGVLDQKYNFDKVKCLHKVGVDPNGCSTHQLTSDEFFKINTDKFDLIFIDGLHLEQQADKDIANSLKVLTKNGTIVLHDCLPYSEWHQRETYEGVGNWAGTVWKSIAKLRMSVEDLSIEVVDTDFGCGIIRRGTNKLFPSTSIDYNLYSNNRNVLMNVISIKQFKEKYCG